MPILYGSYVCIEFGGLDSVVGVYDFADVIEKGVPGTAGRVSGSEVDMVNFLPDEQKKRRLVNGDNVTRR